MLKLSRTAPDAVAVALSSTIHESFQLQGSVDLFFSFFRPRFGRADSFLLLFFHFFLSAFIFPVHIISARATQVPPAARAPWRESSSLPLVRSQNSILPASLPWDPHGTANSELRGGHAGRRAVRQASVNGCGLMNICFLSYSEWLSEYKVYVHPKIGPPIIHVEYSCRALVLPRMRRPS